MMEFMKPLAVAAAGLKAQTSRMRVIAENIANADSTAETKGGDPYRRRVPTFKTVLDRETGMQSVRLDKIVQDRSAFKLDYEPGNPVADDKGYVKRPNVDTLIETVDMREAQRSYEANLNVISATRRMVMRTLEILRA